MLQSGRWKQRYFISHRHLCVNPAAARPGGEYLNGTVGVPGGDETQVGAVPKGSDLRPRSVGDSAQQGTAVSLLGPVGGEHEANGEREGMGAYLGGGRIITWERERLGSLYLPHSC